MNAQYHIRRADMLAALGLPERIPVGQTGVWDSVTVVSGLRRDQHAWLPRVFLLASGVASRIQAQCPRCGRQMRFCGLQQHVGTKTCERSSEAAVDEATRD